MAINDQADIRCQNRRRHLGGIYPDATAFVYEIIAGVGQWQPRCDHCIQKLGEEPKTYTYGAVAYLDPARQRRPESIGLNLDTGTFTYHNHAGYAGHQRVPCNDGCHPYTEPAGP